LKSFSETKCNEVLSGCVTRDKHVYRGLRETNETLFTSVADDGAKIVSEASDFYSVSTRLLVLEEFSGLFNN